jgi:dihydrofolate reductase
VTSLFAADLVDQLNLMVFPVILGSGRRLLAEGTAKTQLRLIDTHPVGPDGVTVATYSHAEA